MRKGHIPSLPHRSHEQSAQRVAAFLRRIPGTTDTRFYKYCQAIQSVTEQLVLGRDPEFGLVLQSFRELTELDFALDVLGEEHLLGHHLEKLERVLRDSALVEDSGIDTPGRDHQLELFVYAILKRAGLRPTWKHVGFDLECRVNGLPVAVEAKRVKSLDPRAIEKRVHMAAGQIQNSGLPGFICLDLSLPTRPPDGFLHGYTRPELHAASRHRMSSFLTENRHKLEQAISTCPVLGMVFIDCAMVHEGTDPRTGEGVWQVGHFVDRLQLHGRNAREQTLRSRFLEYFQYGLPYFQPDQQGRVALPGKFVGQTTL